MSNIHLFLFLLGAAFGLGTALPSGPSSIPAGVSWVGIAAPLPEQADGRESFKPRPVPVDTGRSVVAWRGTKYAGRRQHEGTLSVSESHLSFLGDTLMGGSILIDMNDIRITDIPPHETEPIRSLTEHLRQEFATRRFVHSVFEIRSARAVDLDSLSVTGTLTLRGVRKSLTVPVAVHRDGASRRFTTTLRLSRSEFGVGEDGSWFARNLVDDLFEVRLEIWVTL